MRRTSSLVIAAAFLMGCAAPASAAQPSGRTQRQGVPPGHLPPPGECRVWYDGVPPGQQPPPTSCREAERVAWRDRDARVIYGDDRDRGDDAWRRGDDDLRERDRGGRAIPRSEPPDRDPYPQRYPYPEHFPDAQSRTGYASIPFDNGYADGYEQGRDDARDDEAYEPVRDMRYRSAARGYDDALGSLARYRELYRQGFRAGYYEAYRDHDDREPRDDVRARRPR